MTLINHWLHCSMRKMNYFTNGKLMKGNRIAKSPPSPWAHNSRLETPKCSILKLLNAHGQCILRTSNSLELGHDYIEIEVGIRVVKFVIQWSKLNVSECRTNCHFLGSGRGTSRGCPLIVLIMMTLKKPMGSFCEMGQVKKKLPLWDSPLKKFWVEKGEISRLKILVPNSISSYLRVVLYPK